MKTAIGIIAIWITLAAAFLATAHRLPWEVSLTVVGFLWGFLPLAITKGHPTVVGGASVASFAAATVAFLLAAWASIALMGGIGFVLFELEPSYGRAAVQLSLTGLFGLAGVTAGVAAGSRATGARHRA